MTEPIHNPRCRAQHCGVYAIRPIWMHEALQHIRSGLYTERVRAAGPFDPEEKAQPTEGLPMQVQNGIATVNIVGPMMKGWSKYADTDTLAVRRALSQARRDPAVKGVMLLVDSPGGHVAGTQALADDVALVARDKPVHAYADDLMASAAYWASAPAGRISANRTAIVGSIGAFTVIEDTSKMAEDLGVKVHVIQSGPMKAGAVDGVPVSEEVLAETQRIVDAVAGEFFQTVSKGRGLRAGKRLSAVTTGEVWMASDAQELGLLDAVEPLEVAYAQLDRAIKAKGTPRRDRVAAELRVRRVR